MNKLFNDKTTTGKSGKVLFWSALSVIVVGILNAIIGNPHFFTWHAGILVIIANVALIAIKNLVDPTVKNI